MSVYPPQVASFRVVGGGTCYKPSWNVSLDDRGRSEGRDEREERVEGSSQGWEVKR